MSHDVCLRAGERGAVLLYNDDGRVKKSQHPRAPL